MLLRIAAILLLSLCASQSRAADPPAGPAITTAPTAPATSAVRVREIADVDEYLKHVREIMNLAQNGEYGKLRDTDLDRLADAERDIQLLFGNSKGAVSLNEDQQIRLANDQEVINALIRADDKSRIVCSQAQKTGTRLTTRECMTVEQRELRAQRAAEAAREQQQNLGCVRDQSGQCSN